MPGHRQRGFSLLGLVRADQHAHGWAFFYRGLTSPPSNWAVIDSAVHGKCASTAPPTVVVSARRVDTGLRLREKQTLRSVLTGRWPNGVGPQRVKWSCCAQSPLYPQWPRTKSLSGRQYRNASRAGHVENRPETRAVYGIAALVTTPLCLSSDEGGFVLCKLPARPGGLSRTSPHTSAPCRRCGVTCPQSSTGAAARPRPWLRE